MALIFGLLGGLALFIFGMRTMSKGLSDAVGKGMRLEGFIDFFNVNAFAFLGGAGHSQCG